MNSSVSPPTHRPDVRAQPENRILRALPPEEYRVLLPQLEPFALIPGHVVQEEGEPVDWVVFPTKGMVSLIVRLADGRAVEASAVGQEGMCGISAFLANAVSPIHAVVQVSGNALRLSAARLRREAIPGKRFRTLLERYALALFATSSQSVACIRFHHVVERCARWLLTTHDSVPEGTFELTHEYLATMLGVRRAGVSEAVGALSGRGLIHSERGRFTIVDRPGLEAAACECYRVIRQEFDTIYR